MMSLTSIVRILSVVALALIAVVAGWVVLNRVELLVGWNETFSAEGDFTVVACEAEEVFGPDRWRCRGRLAADGIDSGASTLSVGKDGRMSSRPYVGQPVEVFFVANSEEPQLAPETVYARNGQLRELTRLYLALLPFMMILVGATGALIGVMIGRLAARSTNTTAWWRTSPLLNDLQRRGALWLVAGVAVFALYQLAVHYVLGSAGVG